MQVNLFLVLPLIAFQPADVVPNTNLARVEVRAMDASGKPLSGLTTNDLKLIENQAPRPILHLTRDEQPLDLVLLVDVSAGMRRNYAAVAAQTTAAIKALRPADRLALMSFGPSQKLLLPLTSDHTQLETAVKDLNHLENFRGARLNAPLLEAARLLTENSPRHHRRAILVITDGRAFRGARTAEVLNAVWEGDITINAILPAQSRLTRRMAVVNRATSPNAAQLDADINGLVDGSSGDLVHIGDHPQPLTHLVERIRSRYTAFYEPTAASANQRRILVTLSDQGKSNYPRSTVIGRRLYSAP